MQTPRFDLPEVEAAIVSMDPGRIVEAERELRAFSHHLQSGLNETATPEITAQLERLNALVSNAERLYGDWIQLFSAGTSGYTKSGFAVLFDGRQVLIHG